VGESKSTRHKEVGTGSLGEIQHSYLREAIDVLLVKAEVQPGGADPIGEVFQAGGGRVPGLTSALMMKVINEIVKADDRFHVAAAK
jgi:hypothetical protein